MKIVLEIKNVRLSPQSEAINFRLHSHEHLAIVGSHGSGKTTLGKLLAGHTLVNGEKNIYFDPHSTLNPKVVFVPQRHQYKNLSNTQDFYYQQRFNSLENEDAESVWHMLCKQSANENQIIQILNDFQLLDRKDAPILQLSSGEHKRLQLAKVFLNLPQVLILDQPFTGLDADFRKKFDAILQKAVQAGAQIITITAPQEIPACITHVAEMENFALKNWTEMAHFQSQQTSVENIQHIHLPKMSAQEISCENVIRMRNIKVKYGEKNIIEGLDWTVKPNEKWLITGKNGAGKSTLLSLITGDHPQLYSNDITIFDKKRGRGLSIWDIKKNIGYLSPEVHAHFDKKLTVFQAIGSGYFDTMGLYKTLNEEQKSQINQWIDIFELQDAKNTPLQHLSFLTQRWVLLVRALVKNPPLLIFDEPCQGFSIEQKRIFIRVMDQLCAQQHKTIIYVSHYEDETPQHIDKKLIFNENHTYHIE